MCTGYGLLHMTHDMKLAARTRTEVHMLHTCHYLRTLKSRSWLADGAVGNWTSVMRAPDLCTLRSLAVPLRSLAARPMPPFFIGIVLLATGGNRS